MGRAQPDQLRAVLLHCDACMWRGLLLRQGAQCGEKAPYPNNLPGFVHQPIQRLQPTPIAP